MEEYVKYKKLAFYQESNAEKFVQEESSELLAS